MSAVLYSHLHAASLAIDKLYQPIAFPRYLTVTGLMVLIKLYSEPYQEWTVGGIVDALGYPLGSSGAILSSVERQGYIVRARTKRDRRTTVVQLTKKAKEEQATIEAEFLQVQRRIERTFVNDYGIRAMLNGLETLSHISPSERMPSR